MSEEEQTDEKPKPISMKKLKELFKAYADAEKHHEKYLKEAEQAKLVMSNAVKSIAESGHSGPFKVGGRTLRVSSRKSKEEGGPTLYFFRAYDEETVVIS